MVKFSVHLNRRVFVMVSGHMLKAFVRPRDNAPGFRSLVPIPLDVEFGPCMFGTLLRRTFHYHLFFVAILYKSCERENTKTLNIGHMLTAQSQVSLLLQQSEQDLRVRLHSHGIVDRQIWDDRYIRKCSINFN